MNGQRLVVEADLDFELTLPGSPDRAERRVRGSLRGDEAGLELCVDDLGAFAGRGDAGAVRSLAAGLARRGVTVRVTAPTGPVATVGTTRAPWWQRWLTGSKHIRVAGLGGFRVLGRSRGRAPRQATLPGPELAPPPTVWPPTPTLLRNPPRTSARTHEGGGNPRLVMVPRLDRWDDDAQVFALVKPVTLVGGGEDADIRLPGLEPEHAVIRQDADDEYVLVHRARVGDSLVNGEPVRRRILRTGSRVQLGSWTLSYYREEYADHGRPFGGRIGGELGYQRTQPRTPRPDRPGNESEAETGRV